MEPMIVTGALALRWLNRQTAHQHPDQAERIAWFAAQMRGGYWVCDGSEPVLFDQYGRLIDGRCRLAAVALADFPVKLHVAGWHFGPHPVDEDQSA